MMFHLKSEVARVTSSAPLSITAGRPLPLWHMGPAQES